MWGILGRAQTVWDSGVRMFTADGFIALYQVTSNLGRQPQPSRRTEEILQIGFYRLLHSRYKVLIRDLVVENIFLA
jgi:hypothetical protein